MNDQNNSQAVTIQQAVGQVKKWAEEKNYEQVKQGCEEILEIEPNNQEIKNLLEEANKALNPQAAAAPAEPAPAAPMSTPAPVAEPTPVPDVQPTPEDIFKKPEEPVKQAEPAQPAIEPATEMPAETEKKEEKNSNEKSGLTGKIIVIVVFLALLGGFVFSFMQGWLNPLYDWILGIFGL